MLLGKTIFFLIFWIKYNRTDQEREKVKRIDNVISKKKKKVDHMEIYTYIYVFLIMSLYESFNLII